MRHNLITISMVAALFIASAAGISLAQQGGGGQAAQSKPGMMGGGMMGGSMMGMMGQMQSHHQKMSDLMTKLMASMKAIEDEKDPAALKSKLAEHRALLEEMHTQMMQQGGMMKGMPAEFKKECPQMGDKTKP